MKKIVNTKKLLLTFAFVTMGIISVSAAIKVTTSCGVETYYVPADDATMADVVEDVMAIEEFYCG